MLEILNDKEIMDEYVLSSIIRYNNRMRLFDETVAEHTCFVSIFCLKIMSRLNLSHEEERNVLILAALHDMAESKTSDIPHNVKSNYPEMETILDKIERDYYAKSWKKYFDIIYNRNELAYNILKLADAYSVYQYCLNEIKLGNISEDVREIKSESSCRIDKFTCKINELIKEKGE